MLSHQPRETRVRFHRTGFLLEAALLVQPDYFGKRRIQCLDHQCDLRFGVGPEGQVFLLNKGDGVIRLLVPDE